MFNLDNTLNAQIPGMGVSTEIPLLAQCFHLVVAFTNWDRAF